LNLELLLGFIFLFLILYLTNIKII